MGFRRQAERLAAQTAEGETRGPVEQDVVEAVADATAHRAEPGIGKFPRREGIVGACRLQVAFDAEDPGAALLLPVVAGGDAAVEAARPGRIAIDRSPFITE